MENQQKTPLYFKTFDELKEGEEVILFHLDGQLWNTGGRYSKRGDKLLNGVCKAWPRGVSQLGCTDDYKYLTRPVDRPTPNSWDKYVSDDGILNAAEGCLYIDPRVGVPSKTEVKAARDYLNHLLDN